MPYLRCLLPLLFLPCCVLIGAAPAPLRSPQEPRRTARAAAARERKIVLPGGVADAGGRTGFFTNARGGIDAVDMSTGELLWDTIEAEVPLQVMDDRLIAQAGTRRNRIRILIFDLTRRGECLFESDVVVFPDWVVTGEAPGHSFACCWRLEQARLLLDWEARAWPAHKMRLSEARKAPVQHAWGRAVIDLGSGQVRMTDKPAQPPAPAGSYLGLLQGLAVRWHGRLGGQIKAVALMQATLDAEKPPGEQAESREGRNKVLSALEHLGEPADDEGGPKSIRVGEKLVLCSWDEATRKLLARKTLCAGQRLQVRATLDEKHLCIRQADPGPSENDPHAPRNDPWRVFDLETGEERGRIPYEPGMTSLVLIGRRACYTVPEPLRGGLDRPLRQLRSLKTVDLHSGKLLWQRVVAGKLLTPPAP